jgi:predicted anti-sigma-YlaC factor YlaD
MSGDTICKREQIVAYVDGELDAAAEMGLEQHLKVCHACRTELLTQRAFLCELDAAMSEIPEPSAPSDFARIVAAHAETDMRGVRSRVENRRALRLVLILGVAAFSLLGASASDVFIGRGRAIAANIFGLASFFWKTTYDATLSASIISKVLSRRFVVESGSLGLLVVFLALALLLLSRLIVNYHRARAIE